jgi:hypothetical protein
VCCFSGKTEERVRPRNEDINTIKRLRMSVKDVLIKKKEGGADDVIMQ